MSALHARARKREPVDPADEAEADLLKRLTPRQRGYLRAYGECGGVQIRAARAAKVSPRTARRWELDQPEFAEALVAANVVAGSVLEEEARRRAVDGVRRIKLHLGKPVQDPDGPPGTWLYEHEYSDKLLVEMLRARHPLYRQYIKHDIEGGAPQGDADKGLETLREIVKRNGNGNREAG